MTLHIIKIRAPGTKILIDDDYYNEELNTTNVQDRILAKCDSVVKMNPGPEAAAYYIDDELVYFVHEAYFKYGEGSNGH